MRKLVVLLVLLIFAALMVPTASAEQSRNVEYTWHITNLPQRFAGGAPLYADGTAGGNVPFSFGNGQIILHLQPTTWDYVTGSGEELIDLCFEVRRIKGALGFPDQFCLSEIGEAPAPVSATPVRWDLDGDGDADLLYWARPARSG